MKKHLDEVKRLQKIAGILKESIIEASKNSEKSKEVAKAVDEVNDLLRNYHGEYRIDDTLEIPWHGGVHNAIFVIFDDKNENAWKASKIIRNAFTDEEGHQRPGKPIEVVLVGEYNYKRIKNDVNLSDEDEDFDDINGAPLDEAEFIPIIKRYYKDWMSEKGKKPTKNQYGVVLAHDTSPVEDEEGATNHIKDVFAATVKACGGASKLKSENDMTLTYQIANCDFEGLKSAWKYIGSEGFYEQYSDKSGSLNSANGNAVQWILTKLKTDPGMSQAVARSAMRDQNLNENK